MGCKLCYSRLYESPNPVQVFGSDGIYVKEKWAKVLSSHNIYLNIFDS